MIVLYKRAVVHASMSMLGLLRVAINCTKEKSSRVRLVLARGVIDAFFGQSFHSVVSNINNIPTRLSKREKIAVASELSNTIIHPFIRVSWKIAGALSDVDAMSIYKELDSQERRMN